jgi:hypothetical protein
MNTTIAGLTLSSAKRAVLGTVIAILILTVLEFPPPIGFETRPQSDVASYWLAFFVIILVVEIVTIPMVYRRPVIGGGLGILAAILNILQVIADQTHLLQPEVAPWGYSVLEDLVVLASLALAYFSWVAGRLGQIPDIQLSDGARRVRIITRLKTEGNETN